MEEFEGGPVTHRFPQVELGTPLITSLGLLGHFVDVIVNGSNVPDTQPDDPEC